MFKKKNVVPTPEERIAQASLQAGRALSIFRAAADDLESASQEHASVAQELIAEADRLSELADHADDQASEALEAALRVRSLVG
jgi:signal transduction histidine kinase